MAELPDGIKVPKWPEVHQTDWTFRVGNFDEETQTQYAPYYIMRLLTRVGEQLFTSALSITLNEMETTNAALIKHRVHAAELALKDVVENWIANHVN